MGGGVGISIHGSNRIVTDTTSFALPECSIGLIPDVGSNFYLANAPGHFGEFVGLTGARLNASDALYCGFADDYIVTDNLEAMINELAKAGDPASITRFTSEASKSEMATISDKVTEIFGQNTLTDIIEVGVKCEVPVVQKAVKSLMQNSPLSLCVQFEALNEIRKNPSVLASFQQEYRFVSQVVEHGDFIEGIRAAIIVKDRSPNWKFDSVVNVPKQAVELFRSIPEAGDLTFS